MNMFSTSQILMLLGFSLSLAACNVNHHTSSNSVNNGDSTTTMSVRAKDQTTSSVELCQTTSEIFATNTTCPYGQVITQVKFASYGSMPNGSCGNYSVSSCSASNSLDIVKEACLGQSVCSVLAVNQMFGGNPCPDDNNKLVVDVVCGTPGDVEEPSPTPEPTSTPVTTPTPADPGSSSGSSGSGQMVGGEMCQQTDEIFASNATCPYGQVIKQVKFASYGSVPNGSCGNYSVSSCSASSSLDVVKDACLGQSVCSVLAVNQNFGGNPCPDDNNKLVIDVVCGSPDEVVTPTPTPAPTPNPSATPTPAPSTTPNNGSGVVGVTDPNIYLTPENWERFSDHIITSSPGAYLKMGFTGTSIAIVMDTYSYCNELPKIGYTIDGGAMQYYTAASYDKQLTVPLASGLANGSHQIRISVEGLGYSDRWNALGIYGSPGIENADRLKITQIILDPGAMSLPASLRPKSMAVYGDSITEGANTLGNQNFVMYKQWSTTWESVLADGLNAEVNSMAWQGQGYELGGQGNVPTFPETYNYIRAGVPRTFSNPDYVFINQGTNGNTPQSDVSAMMVKMRQAYPSAKIYFIVPFGGFSRPSVAGAYQAQADPNIFVLDLGSTGESTISVNSTDGYHPTPQGDALLGNMLLQLVPH